jgi:holliday junction DNA helicase RuvA
MYEFIEGMLCELNPAYAIIEAGGIGYHIQVSVNTFSFLSEFSKKNPASKAKLFLHHVVREDAQLLFGFFDAHEREIFRHLVTVSGIGANTARMMLSSMNPLELQKAIAEGNINMLKAVKGVGLKTAQRIIVELKDKIGIASGASAEKFLFADNKVHNEALSALVTLGFAKANVEKIIDKLLAENPNYSVEEVIKQTLRSI